MKKLGTLTYSYISLVIIFVWIITNSASAQSLHIYPLALAVFLVLATIQSLFSLTSGSAYFSKRSIFVLCTIFFIAIRIFYDLDLLKGKELTVGTTGGIIIFYILGCFIKLNIDALRDDWRRSPNHYRIFFISLCVSIVLAYMQIVTSGTETEILENFIYADGSYQRKGSLLTILYVTLLYIYLDERDVSAAFQNIHMVGISLVTGILLFYSQFVRSNSGFATVLLIYIFLLFINYSIKGRNGRLKTLAVYILFLIGGVFYVSTFWPEYMEFISKLRIFGYGSFEFSSVSSRVNLLKESLVQVEYGPIFGDMNSDTKAGQVGKYPHNFFGHSLTHLGIIGLSVMIIIFIAIILKCNFNILGRNLFSKFPSIDTRPDTSAILAPILMISFAFQTITWAPFWFTLGLTFPVIINKKKHYDS